jgi:subtilisin family serine protease
MQKLGIVILGLFLSNATYSQEKMIVFFKDKNTENQLQEFSERSKDRRERNKVKADAKDLLVNTDYLVALAEDGVLMGTSRWLNAVAFSSSLSVSELIARHSFISKITEAGKGSGQGAPDKLHTGEKSLNYGMAATQIEQLNLDCLHDLGYTGNSIYLAVIDAGFNNMDNINYFDSVYLESRVLDNYDFVNNTPFVYAFSGHGTAVSSCIVAEKDGMDNYAGAAIDVSLALYVAEDVTSETEIEEFNVVLALERCDSAGVDLANISLGYFNFDDSTTSHVYADLDGQTTIAAMGVNTAFSKGIIVLTSAGNSGPSNISTPCDASDGFCVGAIDEFGDYASFSSVGPNAAGQVKPDVAAMGKDAWVIMASGDLSTGSGTSFSSPIMAGATACLIQANPTKTAGQIMAAIRESAHQFSTPDSLLGYGIPDFCVANDILNNSAVINESVFDILQVYPVPAREFIIVDGLGETKTEIKTMLFSASGATVLDEIHDVNEGKIVMPVSGIEAGVYTLELTEKNDARHYTRILITD